MTEQTAQLFNYKGYDVLARIKSKKYQIGIKGSNNFIIWFESVSYDDVNVLTSSGREYARIMIDKMILSRKDKGMPNVKHNKGFRHYPKKGRHQGPNHNH